MTKITVNTQPGNRISVTLPRESVKTVYTGGVTGAAGASYLSQLRDVDTSAVANNETLVYDDTKGKYVIKELPIVNGGTF